jgi:hypothetical protein
MVLLNPCNLFYRSLTIGEGLGKDAPGEAPAAGKPAPHQTPGVGWRRLVIFRHAVRVHTAGKSSRSGQEGEPESVLQGSGRGGKRGRPNLSLNGPSWPTVRAASRPFRAGLQ